MKKFWWVIVVLVLVGLLVNRVPKKVVKRQFASVVNKECDGLAKKDPQLIDTIVEDKEILRMLVQAREVYPPIVQWFSTNSRRFVNDQKSDPEVKKVFLIASKYPFAVRQIVENYDRLINTIKNSNELRQDIIKDHGFARYLGEQHTDKFVAILDSSDPDAKTREAFQEYILNKYSST